MTKATPQSIIAKRAHHRTLPTIIAFIVLTILAIVLFIVGISLSDALIQRIALIVEAIFIVIFCGDIITKVSYNNLNEVAITTVDDKLIVYQRKKIITIAKESIYDFSCKNKSSYTVTPFYISKETYNFGNVFLYCVDDDMEKIKITVKNVLDPDRVFERIESFLGLDVYLPEESDEIDE